MDVLAASAVGVWVFAAVMYIGRPWIVRGVA
jgi:hypothetical protein